MLIYDSTFFHTLCHFLNRAIKDLGSKVDALPLPPPLSPLPPSHRRATSKVTATSGGRLTNRYAWVPGRPTRRACLGVNLPLRVPPCKHYPEEVTELKMAALILLRYRQRRLLRRNRIFRDRTNPLHKFNDLELFWRFRFRRADILQMTNELKEELEHLNRKGALPPVFTGRRTALNPCQQ